MWFPAQYLEISTRNQHGTFRDFSKNNICIYNIYIYIYTYIIICIYIYIYIYIHYHNILRARPSCKTQHAKRLSSHSSCAASAGRKKASNATPATRTVMTVMLSPGFLNLTLQTLIPTKWLQRGSVDIKRLESSPWPEMVRKQLCHKNPLLIDPRIVIFMQKDQ